MYVMTVELFMVRLVLDYLAGGYDDVYKSDTRRPARNVIYGSIQLCPAINLYPNPFQ